jgi:hypothetical protein
LDRTYMIYTLKLSMETVNIKRRAAGRRGRRVFAARECR